MLDFNNEEQQREKNYGPVPAGSRVLLRMELVKPKYAAEDHEYIQCAQSGLRGIWAEFFVVAGTYEGVKWRETIWLPTGHQIISLSEGQAKGCNMGGARLKAILESSRGISPKDTSTQATRKRQTGDWLDFHGMEFPAVLGIAKDSYEGKDGKIYWNNSLSRIITLDDKDYRAVMDGGEIITDGPVSGDENRQTSRGNSANTDDPGYEQPPASAYDSDVPF